MFQPRLQLLQTRVEVMVVVAQLGVHMVELHHLVEDRAFLRCLAVVVRVEHRLLLVVLSVMHFRAGQRLRVQRLSFQVLLWFVLVLP